MHSNPVQTNEGSGHAGNSNDIPAIILARFNHYVITDVITSASRLWATTHHLEAVVFRREE